MISEQRSACARTRLMVGLYAVIPHVSWRRIVATSSVVDIIGRALKHWKLPRRRLTYYNAQTQDSDGTARRFPTFLLTSRVQSRPVIIISSYDYLAFCHPFRVGGHAAAHRSNLQKHSARRRNLPFSYRKNKPTLKHIEKINFILNR